MGAARLSRRQAVTTVAAKKYVIRLNIVSIAPAPPPAVARRKTLDKTGNDAIGRRGSPDLVPDACAATFRLRLREIT